MVRQGQACSVRQCRTSITGLRLVRYAGPFPSSFSYDASSGIVKQSLGHEVLLPPHGVPSHSHLHSVK